MRSEALHVLEETELLESVEVEVNEGNSAHVMEMVPVAAFAPGIRPITLANKMKKNNVARKGMCFL